jgi:hypothetical protein
MTLEQIDLIVRRANPVPDTSMLEPVDAPALLDQHRRTDMETWERTATPEQPDKQRRAAWLAVAAAIVIAAAGVIIVMQRGDDTTQPTVPAATTPPPATASPTTVSPTPADASATLATAEGFFDALAAYDSAAAEAYLSRDVLARTYRGADGLRLQLSWGEAIGYKRTRGACDLIRTTDIGGVVRCPYVFDAIRSDEYGLGPFDGSFLSMTIANGTIVALTDQVEFQSNGFSKLVWDPFAEWVVQNHGDDGPLMYADWPGTSTEQLDEQSIHLWEQLSRQYVDADRVGFVGVAPEGAIASDPLSGKVVRTFEWCDGAPTADSGLPLCAGEVRVYDDGRVIWYYRGNLREGAGPQATGWLEQRLTPEGVSTLTQFAQPTDARDMALSLRDESAWPEGTWAEHAIKPFVPSQYSVCVQRFEAPVEGAPAESSVLPPAVANIENGWTWVETDVEPGHFYGYCSDQPTDEARAFVNALPHLGGALGDVDTTMVTEYQFDDTKAADGTAHIVFKPVII